MDDDDNAVGGTTMAFLGLACAFLWVLTLPYEMVSRLIKGDER